MKNVFAAIAAALLAATSTAAFAQSVSSTSNSASQAISNAAANAASNSSGSNNNTNINKNRTQAPGIGGAGLAASGNACLGSVSLGASGPGFGFVFGTTTEDKQCNLRENSKTLRSVGQRRASVEILCKNPEMAEALAVGGYRCTVSPSR